MPKFNLLFSVLISTNIATIALPAYSQALLPYIPELDSQQLEAQGLALAQEAIQLVRFQQYQLALPRAKLATQLAPNTFQTWFILGSIYLQEQEVEPAIQALSKALTLTPPENKADVFFSLGNAYFYGQQYDQAIAQIQSGLKLNPDIASGWFDLGNSYLMLKKFPDAITAYEKAVSIDQEFWPAINNIGLIKYEQGKTKDALAQWQNALKIDPDQAEPKLAVAVALYNQGDKPSAIKMGESALAIDNRYADLKFLKENLWGEKLLADTGVFLANPQIQTFLAEIEAQSPEPPQ